MHLPWLSAAFVSSSVLAIANFVAVNNSLFWEYRWLDIPMHILGGFVLAAFAIGLVPAYRPRFFIAFLASAFIAWEIFELVINVPQPDPKMFDTVYDLVNDSIGAGVAFAIARKTLWRSH